MERKFVRSFAKGDNETVLMVLRTGGSNGSGSIKRDEVGQLKM